MTWEETFDRLERQRIELLRSLEGTDEARLAKPPAPGRWSAKQVIEHLILAEKGSRLYLEFKLRKGDAPAPATWDGDWRYGLLLISLWAPIPFRAPEPVSQPANDRPLQAIAADWAEQRAQLRRLLADLPDEWHRTASYRHPRAGRLSLTQMLGFFGAHVARHSQQVRRALSAA